jgi:UDPglucose--hexose-1-phosphate uridylyltransferase
VLVSPQRTLRPWLGQKEAAVVERKIAQEPSCALCPGSARGSGVVNPNYDDTFVFTNDYPALLPDAAGAPTGSELFRAEPVRGECRVICFSPRHDLTLAEMDTGGIRRVVDLWTAQTAELSRRWDWVQVFENKGAAMGCSNPHPHGQIWATDVLPSLARREDKAQRDYFSRTGSRLLVDYERAERERVVEENPHWRLVVPYWAVWPFETLLLPRRPVATLSDLSDHERDALADILKKGLGRYDALFGTSFPYSMGWHGREDGAWQLHAHAYPPLLRSATVKPQRDLTPEQAAAHLRAAGVT